MPSPRSSCLQELLAGGIAGAMGKTSVAPLERCKILFQVSGRGPCVRNLVYSSLAAAVALHHLSP